MTTSDTLALYEKYGFANYSRLPVVITRAQGSRIWDADGKEYLDFFPGWGVNGIGHCHPNVVAAIRKQAEKLLHVPNNFYTEEQAQLAKALSEHSFGGKCFFCNSGAEANEGAMKLARKFFDGKRYKIITMENSFHGRTLAAITATAQPKYQAGFGPLPEGFIYVPFNDLEAVERAVDDKTAAIMLEPIQGEGGVNVASDAYMKGLRRLCDKTGTLLLLDEVQTGVGRTGTYFGYEHYDIVPDIMTLAKALGGGVAIGAIVAKPKVAAAFVPGTHASTFGGNSLACAAALAVFETIDSEKLLVHTAAVGKYLRARLDEFASGYSFIREVRGRGLMLGVDLAIPGAGIVARCLEKGLNINCTHDTVLRVMPAMTVTTGEIDKAMSILGSVLQESAHAKA